MSMLRNRARLAIVVVCLLIVFGLITALVMLRLSSSVSSSNDAINDTTIVPQAPTDPFVTFAAAGDFDNTIHTTGVLATIAQHKPAFALALGDLAYDSVKTENDWCDMVKKSVGPTLPFELIAGNHDTPESSKTMSIDRFASCLPNRIPNMQGVYGQQYYFDQGNLVRVIMISPGLVINNHTFNYAKDSGDGVWLQDTIDQARQKQIEWVVVGMHKDCITLGAKSCEIGEDLLNTLIDKKVDLILQGHDHVYARSKQLSLNKDCPAVSPKTPLVACASNGDQGKNKSYTAHAGSMLAIVGTGGAPLYKVNPSSPQASLFAAYNGLGTNETYGALIVQVNSIQLKADFVGTDTRTYDTFTLTKK